MDRRSIKRLGQVTAQNFGIKNKALGTGFDAFGKVITLGNLPTKFLTIADDYFKNREFRSEIYARAFSEGMERYNQGFLPKIKSLSSSLVELLIRLKKWLRQLISRLSM